MDGTRRISTRTGHTGKGFAEIHPDIEFYDIGSFLGAEPSLLRLKRGELS